MNMKLPKVSQTTRKILDKKKQGIKLDIGCGGNKQGKEWFGIDYRKLDGVDLVQDLEVFPWALPSECASVAVASHVVEHINPSHGIFISFVNEVWRVLKPGGEFFISAPYATSVGMFRDPTHCNFINEETFSYFSPNDHFYKGALYQIYSPLPWEIKINTWHDVGNLECVLRKLPAKDEYNVDKEYLRILKEHSRIK